MILKILLKLFVKLEDWSLKTVNKKPDEKQTLIKIKNELKRPGPNEKYPNPFCTVHLTIQISGMYHNA